VNAIAWLSHEPNGDPGWSLGFDDRYGNWDVDRNIGNRSLNNTFQVRQLDAQGNLLQPFGQSSSQRSDGARTTVSRFEDGGSYVLTVGQFLEDMYYTAVSSLSRQIVYLRPSQFVIYDRSVITDKSFDQYEAFHFPTNPVEVASPGPGARRFDVNPGVFAGAMTTILPASAGITTSDHLIHSTDSRTFNKLWRTEVRPTDAASASRRWLTVFDLASSSSQVASATAVNVTSGPAVGALLQSAAGNSVVISGTVYSQECCRAYTCKRQSPPGWRDCVRLYRDAGPGPKRSDSSRAWRCFERPGRRPRRAPRRRSWWPWADCPP